LQFCDFSFAISTKISNNCYCRQAQIQSRDERSSKLRDLLHMHDVGILNDDGSLGPATVWTQAPPLLLAPALVGKEAPVRFEGTGAWTPLGNTRKKRKRARKLFPRKATLLGISGAVTRQTKPGRESLNWVLPVTFATSMKMPITNTQLPTNDQHRTKFVTFRAMQVFHGRPRHDDVKMVVEENEGDAFYFAKCRGFFRDGNGDHFVAVQWFNHSQNRSVDPTVKLPKLTLANPDNPAAYSIMPATAIVNGALLVESGNKHYAIMHPKEMALLY